MRDDDSLAMDYVVYDAAVERLDCQRRACGLAPLTRPWFNAPHAEARRSRKE